MALEPAVPVAGSHRRHPRLQRSCAVGHALGWHAGNHPRSFSRCHGASQISKITDGAV
jgi:hypothetical protein